MRGECVECKLLALSGRHSQLVLADNHERLPRSSLLCTRAVRTQGPATNQASLQLHFCASLMQTVCLVRPALSRAACQHNRGCCLPLCFAPEQAAICDQSSKLAAALRCEVGTYCLSCVAGTFAGGACQQRLPPSCLLCTGTVRNRRPIEQACGCSSV